MANTESRQITPEEGLTAADLLAIEMRYEGYNYTEIAAGLSDRFKPQIYDIHWVKNSFRGNGKLAGFYAAYAKEQNRLRVKEARGMFKAHAKNAVRTLVQVMNKSKLDFARVQAAKELLNRAVGESPKIIANLTNDPADRILAELGITSPNDTGETDEDI